ncbi:MAG: flavodoxin family protein [Thermodesulfobacteriota bacterium]|nr:flavodoxin family protein [Thermodesulfobacteriota bacterium]
MKAIGIAGSFRENSNTEFYVKKALETLQLREIETELITLRGKTIKPCTGCYDCVDLHRCTIEEDDFDEIFKKMKEADGIIVGSPVYFSSVVPQLMSLLDRAGFVALWSGRFFSRKVGGPITVARRAGHNLAFSQLLLWFFINGMIVPGSTYWNVGVAGARGARNAKEDEEGIQTMIQFAENMAWLMEKVGHK